MDAPTFRTAFPEFVNVINYPTSLINFWLAVGVARLNTSAWGTLYDTGLQLFTAHYVSIAAQRIKQAATGGQPGAATGPQTSKSVDKVSVGYDITIASVQNAGHWNLTTYGTQFYELMNLVGAGGIQVMGCDTYGSANAFWSGVPGWPY